MLDMKSTDRSLDIISLARMLVFCFLAPYFLRKLLLSIPMKFLSTGRDSPLGNFYRYSSPMSIFLYYFHTLPPLLFTSKASMIPEGFCDDTAFNMTVMDTIVNQYTKFN